MARLTRTYGIDPVRLLELPAWIVEVLERQRPALDAEAKLTLMDAAVTPWLKPEARERVVRSLQNRAKLPRPRRPKPEIVEHNPQKAAEWLRARGIEVVDTPDD